MGSYDFDKDFARSWAHVEYIRTRYLCLSKHVPKVGQRRGDLTRSGFYYELKEDFACQVTNNVAIERRCRGKVSGIDATLSDYWIITAHQETEVVHCFCRTNELKNAIIGGKYRVAKGGDEGSETEMYLMPLPALKLVAYVDYVEPRDKYLAAIKEIRRD